MAAVEGGGSRPAQKQTSNYLDNTPESRSLLGMSTRDVNLVNKAVGSSQKDLKNWRAKDLSDAIDSLRKGPINSKTQAAEDRIIRERLRRF